MEKKKIILIVIIAVAAAAVIALLAVIIPSLSGNNGSAEPETTKTPENTVVITQMTTEATTTTVTTTETTTEETTTTEPETEPVITMDTESGDLTILDDLRSSVNSNSDTAGWIKVPGTMIDYAVVQCGDNDKYLDHNFYGNYYYGGWIFADFRGVVNDYAQNQCNNIILYGHNQADGTMFGTLRNYKIKKSDTSGFSFYKEHPTFTFSNLYHKYTYKIFAIFIIEAEAYQVPPEREVFDYQNFILFSDRHEKYNFNNFLKNVTERSEIITDIDCLPTDKYLTLSTCSNEFDQSRLLVIGRRVREGEDPDVDTSTAKLNPDPLEPDLDYIYGRR